MPETETAPDAGTAHHPPAFCRGCGLIFPTRAIGLQNISVTLKGNAVTCPRCGQMAKIIDGTYSAYKDRLDIVLDPSVPQEARDALLALVKEVQANRLSLSEAKHRAKKINKKFGKIFDVSNWSGEAKATLFGSILMAGAALVGAAATLTAPLLGPVTQIAPAVQVPIAPKAKFHQPKYSLRHKLLSSGTRVMPPNASRHGDIDSFKKK